MEYVEQSADSIRLTVASGSPNINQFKILKESAFRFRDVIVDFGILGTSHFVKITRGNTTLIEICACVEGEFDDDDNILIDQKITDLTEGEYTNENHHYSFKSVRLKDREVNNKLARLHQLRTKKDSPYLTLAFRGKYFFSKKPVTEIYITQKNNQIIAQTIHTYPNEQSAVYTESIFTFEST